MPLFVLVVEDAEPIADNLVELLETLGYFVVAVSNADLGLAIVHSSSVDLIISDIRLIEGASGLDFIQQVRNEGFNIPVIFVTADVSPTTQQEALKLGRVINKPFSILQLVKSIKELV
jgi:two-component system NtrC family response regulator